MHAKGRRRKAWCVCVCVTARAHARVPMGVGNVAGGALGSAYGWYGLLCIGCGCARVRMWTGGAKRTGWPRVPAYDRLTPVAVSGPAYGALLMPAARAAPHHYIQVPGLARRPEDAPGTRGRGLGRPCGRGCPGRRPCPGRVRHAAAAPQPTERPRSHSKWRSEHAATVFDAQGGGGFQGTLRILRRDVTPVPHVSPPVAALPPCPAVALRARHLQYAQARMRLFCPPSDGTAHVPPHSK